MKIAKGKGTLRTVGMNEWIYTNLHCIRSIPMYTNVHVYMCTCAFWYSCRHDAACSCCRRTTGERDVFQQSANWLEVWCITIVLYIRRIRSDVNNYLTKSFNNYRLLFIQFYCRLTVKWRNHLRRARAGFEPASFKVRLTSGALSGESIILAKVAV